MVSGNWSKTTALFRLAASNAEAACCSCCSRRSFNSCAQHTSILSSASVHAMPRRSASRSASLCRSRIAIKSALSVSEGQEVFALDAEGMSDETVEVGLTGERQVALEDHSIRAGPNGAKGRGELDDERVWRVHGVRLR